MANTNEDSLPKRIGQLPLRLKNYVDELKTEMRRVTWPNAKQVRATTVVVIASVFLFAGYFALVDTMLGRAINSVFDAFAG